MSCHTVLGFTTRLRWRMRFLIRPAVMDPMGVAAPKNGMITLLKFHLSASHRHSERPSAAESAK